jgi:hypothetical protein
MMGEQDIGIIRVGGGSYWCINPLSARWYARHHEEVSERHVWNVGSILHGS